MNMIQKEARDNGSKYDVVQDLMTGMYKESLECNKCDRSSTKDVPFECLMVEIPNRNSKIKLEDCIKQHLAGEEVEYRCDKCTCGKMLDECVCELENRCPCNKSTQKRKIGNYPEVLIVQLKRFVDKKKKNNRYVEVPMKINKDGTNFVLAGTIEHSGSYNHGHYKAKCWNEKREK